MAGDKWLGGALFHRIKARGKSSSNSATKRRVYHQMTVPPWSKRYKGRERINRPQWVRREDGKVLIS